MKRIIAILITALCTQFCFSQDCPISFYDLDELIENGTNTALKNWTKQKPNESNPSWAYRLKNQTKTKKLFLEDSITQAWKTRFIESLPPLEFEILEAYNEESRSFKVGISCFDDFTLLVPIEKAEAFENDDNLEIKSFDLEENKNEWALAKVEIFSPVLGETFTYNSESMLNILEADEFSEYLKVNPNGGLAWDVPDHPRPDGNYDIHDNLPQTKNQNENGIAIIISNHDYSIAQDVEYAIQDGKAIKKYLTETMGYLEENIFVFEDISRRDFASIFGSHNTFKGKLFNKTQSGENDIFIYYSGHGVPGLDSKNAYFLPVDCDPSQADLDGYPLDLMLENLAKIPAKSKTVVIDACFSGANIEGLSGVNKIGIRQKINRYNDGKTIVMTSSKEDQFSTWYPAKEQGLFTYYFLKAIHDQNNSDTNSDGKLTYGEIFEYVSDKKSGVPHSAGVLKIGLQQTPEVILGERLLHKDFIIYE